MAYQIAGPQYGLLPGVQWVYRHRVDNADGDEWVYDFDNCPNVANDDQLDTNHNLIGDVCDGCPFCCSGRLYDPATASFSYFQLDIRREAAFVGLPFRWPRPDPVSFDPATRTYPKEQPHIHRLTRLGMLAAELGRGLAYLAEVSRVIWSGEVDDWPQGDHLDRAAERAGLDPATLNARVEAEADRLHAVVEANQVAQRAAGHYGVPMIAFGDEPFFGQDRFDQFRWRLEQSGLARR